ncbi:MAG: hypothetical protein AB7G28_22475 [Pirellulales bacterium]
MVTAPQQNWQLVEKLSRADDVAWLRSLSSHDRFALYAGLLKLIRSSTLTPEEQERLERQRWEDKLVLRRKTVEAFHKLDELHRGRAATNHPD